ncbi:MAG: hypothetical protein KQJ78_22075 [Deltaproteobacteria bacterium]|nr:hypothetical protein [Deltaproteobacteria bacterium]
MGKQEIQELQTPQGLVQLRTYVRDEELARYRLDLGIGVFSRYRSILTSLPSLMEQASHPDTNLCLALHEGDTIVGYAVLRQPPPGERWGEMKPPLMYELFGENARGWRGLGLMKPMIHLVVNDPANDDRIIYIVGYSWHWDLDETGKDTQAYRETIIHLLTPLGFKQYPTNEPNVSLRPENLFMVRLGKNLEGDRTIRRRLTNLLFGIQEDD